MALQDFLTNSMDIYETLNPQAFSGGMKVLPVLQTSGVACRITDDNAGQEVTADGKNIRVTHTIYTFYTGMMNGWTIIEPETGARFRFLGNKTRRAIGGIPQFQVLLFQQIIN